MGARGVAEAGDAYPDQRGHAVAGDGVLPRQGGSHQTRCRRRARRYQSGLDRFRGGLREHAPRLLLLPPMSVRLAAAAALFLLPWGRGLGQQTGVVHGTVHDSLGDRKSTRLNSSHLVISYAVFCLKKKKNTVARNIRRS